MGRVFLRRNHINETVNNNPVVKMWMLYVLEMIYNIEKGVNVDADYEEELTQELESEYASDFYVNCNNNEMLIYDHSNDGMLVCTPESIIFDGKLDSNFKNDVNDLNKLFTRYKKAIDKDAFIEKLYDMRRSTPHNNKIKIFFDTFEKDVKYYLTDEFASNKENAKQYLVRSVLRAFERVYK